MATTTRPTFQALVDQALSATGATTGWLLVAADDGLEVAATAGRATTRDLVGTVIPATGAQGYVLSSGQPAALLPQPNDGANNGAAGFVGVPTSLLAAPCGDEAILGVLELAEKADAGPFTFDDIAIVATLASVAGAAISEGETAQQEVVSPAELANELSELAARNPNRYADTARLIESLLGQGA